MSPLRFDRNIFDLELLEVRRFLTTASVDGANTLQILGTSSSETITVNRNSSNRLTVTGVGATFVIGNSAGQVNKIVIQAGSGNDTVLLTNNVRFPSNNAGIPATIAGNNGNDTLTGGPGNDVLSGNDGADTMDGGVGNDLITGGANTDTTNYSNRATALRVSINNNADADGQVSIGENDQVETEEVIGGAGNDTLIGSDLQDFLAGGGGADSITGNGGNDEVVGSTGADKLFGNTGDDYIGAQNNDQDTVSGGTDPDGTDFDAASVDPIDVPGAGGSVASLVAAVAAAQGSDLDPDYGVEGIAQGPDDLGWSYVTAAIVDEQGRAYFAGYDFNSDSPSGASGNDFVVARYTAAGVLDTDFGVDGVATIDFTSLNGTGYGYNDDDIPAALAFDADGNIIVVGRTRPDFSDEDFAVARLTSAGALDGTFGDGGRAIMDFFEGSDESAVDVVVQSDGNIVVVGNLSGEGTAPLVARFTDAGLPDESFGGGDGNLLVSFGGFDQATAVALQNLPGDDGAQRIVVGGTSNGDFALARLLPNGTLDETFGVGGVDEIDGVAITDFGGFDVINDLAVNSLNQIVAVGEAGFLITFRPASTVATLAGAASFGAAGTAAVSTAAQEAGDVDGVVAVYAPDANAAPSFVMQPPVTDTNLMSYRTLTIDSQDRIVVGGTDGNDFAVARYLSTLTFDSGFNSGVVITDINFSDTAVGIGVATDGAIVAAGRTSLPSEATVPAAVRFLGEGEEPNDLGIEEFVSYEDLQQNPPPGSPWAQLYMLAQQDSGGAARIRTTDPRNNVVNVFNVLAEDGTTNVAVNIDGLTLYYETGKTKVIEIRLGGGDDQINFLEDVGIPFVIDLGEGNDRYRGGNGNDYVLGGPGNDDLDGGQGNDLLSGGPGDDQITGGSGHDLLIGGEGRDKVQGNSGEDILIAGMTAYEEDGVALFDILQEWASDSPRATRILNIRNGGGLNGTNVLTTGVGGTVFDDGDSDQVHGASGANWVFYRESGPNKDKATSLNDEDEVDLI